MNRENITTKELESLSTPKFPLWDNGVAVTSEEYYKRLRFAYYRKYTMKIRSSWLAEQLGVGRSWTSAVINNWRKEEDHIVSLDVLKKIETILDDIESGALVYG